MSVVSPRPRLTAPSLVCIVLSMGLLAGCGPKDDGPDPKPSSSAPPSAGDPGSDNDPAQYVALGDSYTSAPGVPDTVDEGCFRSDANYPSLVAHELDLTLDDVSCGGAATTALVGVQETADGPVQPQLLALSEHTEVVTLGIGGNDDGLFGQLLASCLELGKEQSTGSPCRDRMNAGGSDKVLDTIALIQTRITSALVGIEGRAPDAEVVLVGYPQLVPDHVRCELLPLTSGDYTYMHEVFEALGAATKQAAEDAGARYVDVLAASAGHDICAGDDAWISGYVSDPERPAQPMHPFAEEQEAVAELVVAALDD